MPKISENQLKEAEAQIIEEQKIVDYDVKEYVVEILVNLLDVGDIFIPEYQRGFVWPTSKQNRFIESLILGLPIPYLFCADQADGRLEVVDGAQRIQTIKKFMDNKLRLNKLDRLSELNGFRFSDLPVAQQRKFRARSLRMIVLSEKSGPTTRFDLFERINSGSVTLTPAEFRKGAFQGPFYQMVLDCAASEQFTKLCPIGKSKANRGEHAELALRFFAYSDSYEDFVHDVARFLNEYVHEMNISGGEFKEKENSFFTMLDFVDKYLPYGFRKSEKVQDTPRVRFESISVGIHLALQEKPDLSDPPLEWLTSNEFQMHTTTHASNSGPRLRGRIEYVRDALLS